MSDLGYENNSSMLNLGSLALFTIAYYFKLLMYGLFCAYMKRQAEIRKNRNMNTSVKWEAWEKENQRWIKMIEYKQMFYEKLIWGEILAILLEACFEFYIAGYLQFQHPLIDYGGEIISVIVGFVCLVMALIILPILFIYILQQDKERLQDISFNKKFGVLYENIRLVDKWTTAYYLFYVLRRMIFCLIVFFLD